MFGALIIANQPKEFQLFKGSPPFSSGAQCAGLPIIIATNSTPKIQTQLWNFKIPWDFQLQKIEYVISTLL